jgi:NAD(P)-dependent dehydrogenase (short-subunit alcohol dehydrogenase family)
MTTRRSALVTGATSDIGIAICNRLMQEGFFVYAAVRDEERARVAFSEALAASTAKLVISDLSLPDAPNHLIEALSNDGELELIVNNAGGTLNEPAFTAGEVHDGELTYRMNVLVPYELAVLGAEKMRRGSIVNVTSVNSHSTMVGAIVPVYSSSKAALAHMTRLLANRLAPSVRVNAVAPGRTRTGAWGSPGPEVERHIVNDALIERWVTPGEVADAVWFLHNNEACTGVELPVDGGIGLKATLSTT